MPHPLPPGRVRLIVLNWMELPAVHRFVLLPLAVMAAPLGAQALPPTAGDAEARPADTDKDEILVIATRLRGQVDAPQVPVITLNEADIAAYGASSLPDLIAALSPQTGSGRGRGGGAPVILLNGQRIASFREMRNIPPEAIRRMEVLPEEVALRYGYPPDQRVINLILKDHFSSRTLDGEFNRPSRGGFSDHELNASMLAINGASRFNLAIETSGTGLLTEQARAVMQPVPPAPAVPGDPDPAAYRSLIPSSRNLTLNTTFARGLGQGGKAGSISVNGSISRADSRSLSGLDAVLLTSPTGQMAWRTLPGPLARTTRTATALGGISLNTPVGSWQLSVTLDGSHAESESLLDRRTDTAALVAAALAGSLAVTAPLPAAAPAGADHAQSNTETGTGLVTLVGRPVRLPAGDVQITIKAGFAYSGIESRDTRGSAGFTSLKRGDLSGGINIALPIASRNETVLAPLGDLTLNLSGGLNRLSDFGTLADWSAGLVWTPVPGLGLQASYIVNEAAPSLGDLGNPLLVSFNVPVFDFTRIQSVLVTVTSGGNPALASERQRDVKLGLTWQLPFLKNSNVIAEIFRNRSSDVTAPFPLLTPEIEAAFPGRVIRDASGRLVSIDRRAVTLAQTSASRLRYGINLSGVIGKPVAGRGGAGRGFPGGPPGGLSGGPPGGLGAGGFRAMMGGGQGRWNLSLYHTVRFSDQVRVAPGGPVLDLLGGDALSGGGSARHSLELEGGVFHKGFGLRLNGSWSAPSHVSASGLAGASDLRFGSVARLDLRLFSDLGQQKALMRVAPFFRNARLALQFDNVLDSRQKVTDSSGAVPLSYQSDYLDPRGRVVGIDFRKLF